MKYLIAVDAIMRGHISPTHCEGLFFWCQGDQYLLTSKMGGAQQFDTRKEAEDAVKSDNVTSEVEQVMMLRSDIFVLELEEKELFKLTLKYPNANISLD